MGLFKERVVHTVALAIRIQLKRMKLSIAVSSLWL